MDIIKDKYYEWTKFYDWALEQSGKLKHAYINLVRIFPSPGFLICNPLQEEWIKLGSFHFGR